MPRKDNRRLILFLGIFAFIAIVALIIAVIVFGTKTCKDNFKETSGSPESPNVMIASEAFGQLDGQQILRYSLRNKNGYVLKILNYGGIITNIMAPDKNGDVADITLGFDDFGDAGIDTRFFAAFNGSLIYMMMIHRSILQGYRENPPYFGAIIGRYANRIAKGQFTIDGKNYTLAINNGQNSLHGGIKGFDKKIWDVTVNGDTLELKYTSIDGEEGYPGDLTLLVTYKLTDSNELHIDYTASTTKTTVINLTNHAYFNLAGESSGSIDDHVASISAQSYLPVNSDTIPTGDFAAVDGTAFDLRSPKRLGDVLFTVPGNVGYDHCYCFEKTGWLKTMARVVHPPSGRFIEVSSTEPGMQFYTAFYNNVTGKGGNHYGKFSGFCLETQHYPDSPNQKNFPTTFLSPGETFRSTTIFKFGVDS